MTFRTPIAQRVNMACAAIVNNPEFTDTETAFVHRLNDCIRLIDDNAVSVLFDVLTEHVRLCELNYAAIYAQGVKDTVRGVLRARKCRGH